MRASHTWLLVLGFLALFLFASRAQALRTEGALRYAGEEPPDLSLGAVESDQIILLYREKRGYVLADDLAVDCVVVSGGEGCAAGAVPAGSVVDVYLLHFDSVGEHAVRLTGSVTFSGRLLGLEISTSGLEESDFLGSARFAEHGLRGLELGYQDSFSVSDDLHGITFNLKVTNVLDEVRLIVEHTEGNEPPLPPSNPSPPDGARDLGYGQVSFSWTASDPDGDPLRFRFYFGEGPGCTLDLLAEDLSEPAHTVTDLQPLATYCWQVEACDQETCTVGPLWTFSTGDEVIQGCSLRVTVSPEDGGTVSGRGLSCPGDCEETLPCGTVLTLEAQPAEGYLFRGWSGDCAPCGNSPECILDLASNTDCTALFGSEAPGATVAVDLKVNGSDGPVELNSRGRLLLAVSLDPLGNTGLGDYFLWARTPWGACFCLRLPVFWDECDCDSPAPTFTGPLMTLQDFEVLTLRDLHLLQPGPYEIHFAVDTEANGALDERAAQDEVEILLSYATPCEEIWDTLRCREEEGCGWTPWPVFHCVPCWQIPEEVCEMAGCHRHGTWCE